jgi:hypothetical protein
MRLNFKTLAGRSFSIAFDDDLDDELTVRYAKEAIEKQESIPDFRITLVFEGTKLLEETTPLEEYDVLSGGSDLPATRTRHAPLTPHSSPRRRQGLRCCCSSTRTKSRRQRACAGPRVPTSHRSPLPSRWML